MSPSLHPRPLLRVVLPLLFIGLTSISTAQTWQRIALQGIAIGTLVRGGDGVLLASGPQSIYRSTDAGLTWESLLGIGGFRLMNGDRRLLVGVANTALAISTSCESKPACKGGSGCNQTRAAELLGISRDQLRYRLKRLEGTAADAIG